MDELNLDMFRVIVEGKVFAVQHRELKKRGAWVVCFDMTDYTSSVRVNQFMEAAKAKPIIDNVQAGMWLRVQGKMSFDRYDNEMVLQPTAMEKIEVVHGRADRYRRGRQACGQLGPPRHRHHRPRRGPVLPRRDEGREQGQGRRDGSEHQDPLRL